MPKRDWEYCPKCNCQMYEEMVTTKNGFMSDVFCPRCDYHYYE